MHPSIDRHLDWFHTLVIINNGNEHGSEDTLGHIYLNSFGYIFRREVGLLDHIGVLLLAF
jgi:hypothetical protein